MKGTGRHHPKEAALPARPVRRTLAERLAASPKTPSHWVRDPGLRDRPLGRERI